MDQRLVDQFRPFDTSIVSDALDAFDVDGVITGLTPANPDHVAVGRATTVSFTETTTPGEQTNFPYAMLEAFEPEHIMLIKGVSPRLSCWGGRASQLADNAGLEGVIIEGGYRDVDLNRAGSFPVFARAATPLTGQRRVEIDAVGEPLTIDGVTVSPGDLLVADATGVVAVPASIARDVLETAEDLYAGECLLEAKIENGATVADLKSDDHEF